jgi:NADH-quinone oxidoreductase subunit J
MEMLLLTLMFLTALWAVMARTLLKSAIALALASVLLTIIMFVLKAPWAGVFELSVCAGLITVVFISAISLTQPENDAQVLAHAARRFRRFWFLPVLLALVAVALYCGRPNLEFTPLSQPSFIADVRNLLWKERMLDLLGQVVIILVGVFGVVVLFKERSKS